MTDNQSNTLVRDLIRDTSTYNLVLSLTASSLEVMAYSPFEDNSLIYRSLPLDSDAASPLKALQEVVYDNPLLLRQWARIYFLVDSSTRLILDDAVSDDDLMTLMTTAFPEVTPDDTILVDNPLEGVTLAYNLDNATEAFIRRTFFNVNIAHRLSPLMAYFVGNPFRGTRRRLFLNISKDSVDFIASRNASLVLANTYLWKKPDDIAYYILAAASIPEVFDNDRNFDILLAGDPEWRAQVAPTISRLVATAMPVIFPSQMFHAGKESMLAPFEMVVRPLVSF